MSWKIRHQGSPLAIEGLELLQVIEGMQDGLWEPTDEVMGPGDIDWMAIENHPQLEEIAADIEPPPPRVHDDETRLDMNPLIDVCLVLLIFFILTTTYAALQKVLDLPGVTSTNALGVPVYTKEKVKEFTIKVEARQKGDQTTFRVEDQTVGRDDLVGAIGQYVKETRKTQLLLDADPKVPWSAIVDIEDAAKGAGVQKIHFLQKEKK
jgi:biopolymer transport protein ExbD